MAALMDQSFDMPPLHLPDDAELFDSNFTFGGSIDHFQCGNGYVWTPEVVDDCESVIAIPPILPPNHLLDVSEKSWNPSWMHDNAIGFNARQRPQVAFRGEVSHAAPAVSAPTSNSSPASGESTPSSAPKRRKTAPNKLAASPDPIKPRPASKQPTSKIEVSVPEPDVSHSIRTPETSKRKKIIRDKPESGKSIVSAAQSNTHNVLWSEAEHALFEIGLSMFGRGNWVLISQHVGTRNHLQVKYHARQYFRKLESGLLQPGAVPSPGDSATPTPKGSSRSNSDQGSVESDDLSVGQTKTNWNAGRESFYTFAEEQGLAANAAAVDTFSHMASKRHNQALPLTVRN
jgi:hypothetical protein